MSKLSVVDNHNSIDYESCRNCAAKENSAKDENCVYQTLNLDELNYESMYAKIVPTQTK